METRVLETLSDHDVQAIKEITNRLDALTQLLSPALKDTFGQLGEADVDRVKQDIAVLSKAHKNFWDGYRNKYLGQYQDWEQFYVDYITGELSIKAVSSDGGI